MGADRLVPELCECTRSFISSRSLPLFIEMMPMSLLIQFQKHFTHHFITHHLMIKIRPLLRGTGY